jgi:uncharacterized membrane protein YecN with MAPEG domain
MVIPVTAVVASATSLLALVLSYRVTVYRRRFKSGLGTNGDRDFEAAVRAHANLMEYAPLTLVLLGVGELNGVSELWIYALGMLFVVSRLAHAWGFIQSRGGQHMGRFFGTAGTWLTLLVLALLLAINVAQYAGRW